MFAKSTDDNIPALDTAGVQCKQKHFISNLVSRRVHMILARGGKISREARTFFFAPPWNCFVQKVNEHHKIHQKDYIFGCY